MHCRRIPRSRPRSLRCSTWNLGRRHRETEDPVAGDAPALRSQATPSCPGWCLLHSTRRPAPAISPEPYRRLGANLDVVDVGPVRRLDELTPFRLADRAAERQVSYVLVGADERGISLLVPSEGRPRPTATPSSLRRTFARQQPRAGRFVGRLALRAASTVRGVRARRPGRPPESKPRRSLSTAAGRPRPCARAVHTATVVRSGGFGCGPGDAHVQPRSVVCAGTPPDSLTPQRLRCCRGETSLVVSRCGSPIAGCHPLHAASLRGHGVNRPVASSIALDGHHRNRKTGLVLHPTSSVAVPLLRAAADRQRGLLRGRSDCEGPGQRR